MADENIPEQNPANKPEIDEEGRFKVKKKCSTATDGEFYRFIYTYYFHQDALSWSRTQTLFLVEAAILGAAFSKRGAVAMIALAIGSLLVLLIWNLIRRDWQVRDQYNLYFDEFHKEWAVRLTVPPKGYWYRGGNVAQAVAWLTIVFNLCCIVYFSSEMYFCWKMHSTCITRIP